MKKQDSYSSRATKGFAWNYLYKLSEFGLLNLFNIIIARFFGPVGSAPYVVYTALGTTISILATFGVDGITLRYLPRILETEGGAEQDIASVGVNGLGSFVLRLFTFRLLVVSMIVILTGIVFILLPSFDASLASSLGTINEFAPYLIIFLFAQSIIAFCSFALIALLDIKMLFFTSIIIRSLAIVALGVLYVHFDLGIENAVRIHTLSAVVTASLFLLVLFRSVRSHQTRSSRLSKILLSLLEDLKQFLLNPKFFKAFLLSPVVIYGIATWGNDILSSVLGKQPDILMIRVFFGERSRQIGIYNVASILLLVTEYLFLFGFGGTLISVLSKLAHDDEAATENNTVPIYPLLTRARKEVAGIQNILLLPLCGLVMAFAFPVVEMIYGRQYADSVPLLQFGLVILAVNVGLFGGGLQLTSLVAIGKVRLCFKNRLFWGIMNLVGNFFLIQRYGAFGAIIGSQLANALACMTEGFFARRFIGGSVNYISTVRIALVIGLFSFCSYFAVKSFFHDSNAFMQLVAGSAIYVVLVVTSFYVLKFSEFRALLNRLKIAAARGGA